MNAPPEMRSPAPRANAGNRAEVVRNDMTYSTPTEQPEAFAASYVAQHFRLSLPMARLVCRRARIGESLA